MAEILFKNWIKITMGKSRGELKLMYYRRDLPWQLFQKWKWYFEYRAALIKVQNPRMMVEYEYGSMPFVPPKEELLKRINDRIIAKKGKITSCEKKMSQARKAWNSIFPIETDPLYQPAVDKINRLKKELITLELDYQNTNQTPSENVQNKSNLQSYDARRDGQIATKNN